MPDKDCPLYNRCTAPKSKTACRDHGNGCDIFKGCEQNKKEAQQASPQKELRIALRWLLDASKPYLRRKKVTTRNDCAVLNAIHEECEKLLKTN